MERVPEEAREKVAAKAASIIETRTLTRILEQASEEEREALVSLLDKKDAKEVTKFLMDKEVDVTGILKEEIEKFREKDVKDLGL